LTSFEGPHRIHDTHHLYGTQYKPWRSVSSHVCPINSSINYIGTYCVARVVFLSRALLKNRSGIRSSDSVVYYLIRNVIQIGLVATTWAIAALVTWFLLPQNSTYRIFDITSGTVYTQAMFEGLLSRRRLRKHMFPSTYLDLGIDTQQSHVSGRFRSNSSKTAKVSPSPCDISGPEPGPSFTPKGDVLQLESLSTGKADYRHEI